MRFGMSGCFLPADMNDVTPDMCRRVRSLGFSGIFTRFSANPPRVTPRHLAQRVRDVLAGEGVRMYQSTGYWQNLVTPDESARKGAVTTVQAALRLAGWLGARGIDTGPGSMAGTVGDHGSMWWPHPLNWTAESRRQLVKTLKECAPAAQDAGVYLSLEGAQTVTLDSALVTREVLDEVGSPWVRSDYDAANWLTLKTVYDSAAAIEHDFDVLGGHIVSCHAKDAWPVNHLNVRVDQGCPGKGRVDFRTLFNRMEALSPDYPVIAEGNSTEELPQVSALFHGIARELGITIRGADDHG
jgi:sugar phosphate isomerase/epimerase